MSNVTSETLVALVLQVLKTWLIQEFKCKCFYNLKNLDLIEFDEGKELIYYAIQSNPVAFC